MVNEEKVILMTKLASYEAGEGKKYVSIANYFRTDYISSQMLKSVIAGVIAFMTIIGVYIFYNFEMLMENIYSIDLMAFAKKVGILFAVCLGIYVVISYLLAVYRFNKARGSLKTYYNNLKKLERL